MMTVKEIKKKLKVSRFIELEVDRFKALIESMFNGYPSYGYKKTIEEVIRPEIIKILREDKILKGVKIKDKVGNITKGYILGVNALPLISSWKIEKLTKWLIGLTTILIILTLILIFKELNIL